MPVICHDATLARTHGRPERVDALTADALEALGVPTLADVLVTAGRGPFLDVELKGDPGPRIVEVLAGGRGPGLSNAVVSSFEAVALERIAHLAPSWPRWLNMHTLSPADVAAAVALGCRGVAVDWRALDRRSVARAQAAGLEVAAYTVRRRPTFDRLARLGRRRGLRGGQRPRRLDSAERRRVDVADHADLVIVGAGTIGGWTSVFARNDGIGRVVVLERGLIVWATPRLARRCGVAEVSALWLGAANPLLLMHLVAGIHNEALMLGLMLAGHRVRAARHRFRHARLCPVRWHWPQSATEWPWSTAGDAAARRRC